MRDWSVQHLCLAACVSLSLFTGCGTTPPITVVRAKDGDKIEEVHGDKVKLKRGAQDIFAGANGGFFVVRTVEDWQRAWPADRTPPLPTTIDTSSQMVLLAVAESRAITNVTVQRALETAEMIYVWVRETKLGTGCVNKATEAALDGVVTTRVDKPVRFFVAEEQGESCGDPPTAHVECRVGNQKGWASKVTADPGDKVECALTASARGKFELVDKSLSMAEQPAGSSAKLTFRKGAERADLDVDVYGTYTIMAEAADEAGRRGKATATVDVKPPKTKDVLVQLVWAGFDVSDDPNTFPRVNLRIAEEGPKGQRCSADVPVPGLCELKSRGAYTYMRVPAGDRRLPVSIQYTDERVEKGPGPCVHVWFDGARTAETCDRKHRKAEEIWKIGTLDTSTGKVALDPSAGPPPATGAADAGAAGAPEAPQK